MNRKKFFTSISLSAAGLFVLNSIPFGGIIKKIFNKNDKITVKTNPLAVSRKKTGVNHG
jgi:hypothetical protein